MSDPLGLFTNQGTQDPLGLFGSGEEDQPSKIPGVARQVPRPADPSALDYLRGGIESTAAITSAAAMSIPALLATPFFGEKGFNRVMKEAYQPRGEVGQDWTDKAGHVAENLNALGASGIGEFVGIPARLSSAARLRGAKDVAPNNIRAKLKEIKEEPKLAAIEKARQEDIASRNPKNRQANDLAALGDESGQMALFDQGDQMGKRNQFNAGDLGDWRIDENGIPVRVDKSLEALNVEQPLQRNLWGDELGPALDQGRSLTQSIDDTPKDGNWAQRRGMTNRLGGDGRVLEPGNDLLTAKMEADGPKLPFEEQTKFEPTNPMETRRLGDDPLGLFGDMEKVNPIEGIKPKAEGNRAGATIEMTDGTMPKSADAQWLLDQTTPSTGVDKLITATVDGNVVGHLELAINPDGTASVRNVTVDPAYQRQGIATELYNRAKEAGYTIERSPYQTEAGAAFREVYDTNNSLRNAEILPPEERIPKPDTPATPRTPETIQERADNRALVESFPVKDGLLSEWTPIATKEEALSMAADTKDLTKSFKQRSLAPGMNFMAAMSRNPILRYASTILRDARVAMEFDSRRFISNNDALSPQWSKLSSDERVRSMEALQAASDEKMHLTPEHMDKLGLNEKEQAFVTKVREAMDYTLDLANEKRATLGLKPIEKLPGYLPSVFKGAYKSFVLHDGKVVGIISTDTKWGLKLSEKFYSELAGKFTDETALGREKAVAYYNKEYPGVNFQEAPRKGLSGNGRQSDLFSGTNDILSILAQNDPRFADIQNAIAESIKKSNNSLYNFNNHELAKKGITGNEGNKPWLKPLENTEAGFKSMIGFLEDAFNYHHLQVPLYELKTMNTAPEVAHLPRTMKYLDDYVKNVTGQGVNSVGRAINSILDYAPALVGVGPNVPLGIAGAIKNQASRIFMGYGNYMFTAAQMMQPFQTATPLMTLLGGRLGNTGYIPKAMFNGNTYAMLLSLEKLTGKTFDMIPEHLREGWQYAQDRGMSNFSEMERAYEGTKTKLGRAHDKLAEINMQLGESTTRAPTFLAILDLLHNKGMPLHDALGIAENVTQVAMIDYHQWERPLGYQSLGVLGQFAGGLTTFKHGYMGQQGLLIKEAFKGKETGNLIQGKDGVYKPEVNRNAIPILTSAAAMIAFAGVTGIPFYNDLDAMYGSITDLLGEKKSIKESVLENNYDWFNYGLPSIASGVFLQSKFSSADMIPDSVGKALSPQLAYIGGLGSDIWDLLKNPDAQARRNLAIDASPSSIKGIVESKMSKDETGNVMDRKGKPLMYRSEEDWDNRKYLMARPTNEVIERSDTFQATRKMMADMSAKKTIMEDYLRAFRNNTLDASKKAELTKKYADRKGNPEELVQALPSEAIGMQQDERQRAEGIPKNDFNSIMRYKYYNK